jgi:hypothetical protein
MQRRLGKVPPVNFVEGNLTPKGATGGVAVGWLCINKSHPPQGETPFLPWLKTRGFLEDFYEGAGQE